MIKYYFSGAPNPAKVSLFLEEAGLEYEPIPVDTRKGEQHDPEFRAVNPNGKVPVIIDGDVTVFDSNAILLYLGEKTGKFMPDASKRGELLSWLMFIGTGVGPYSGQAVHFQHMAPGQNDYAIGRYRFEVERHYEILNDRLANQPWLLGAEYTILDMSLWGWARMVPGPVLGEGGFDPFPHVKRHLEEISARPAAQRAEALKDKFTFKAELDDEAKKAMFPGKYYK